MTFAWEASIGRHNAVTKKVYADGKCGVFVFLRAGTESGADGYMPISLGGLLKHEANRDLGQMVHR